MPPSWADHVAGLQEEQVAFRARNPQFVEIVPHLERTAVTVIGRRIESDRLADIVVAVLNSICADDFLEIVLLAANSFGFGAARTLRSMYESAVTARYLSLHPEKAQDFLDYGSVEDLKLRRGVADLGFADLLPPSDDTEAEEIEKRFKVRGRSVSWAGPLDFVSMAKQTVLGNLVVNAYLEPLRFAHPSTSGLFSRMKITESGLSPIVQHERADEMLRWAHFIVISVLDLQAKFLGFYQEVEADILKCWDDNTDSWESDDAETRDESAEQAQSPTPPR